MMKPFHILSLSPYALLKFLSVKTIVKPLQTPWYRPKGWTSLKRVRQWMRDVFQSNGIFKGVSPNPFSSINPTNHDFITLQGMLVRILLGFVLAWGVSSGPFLSLSLFLLTHLIQKPSPF